MPDRRTHRGSHPADADLFGVSAVPLLSRAAREFCWLLDREYSPVSALKLVGDRYQLRDRQRTAVLRSSCTRTQRRARIERCVPPAGLEGQTLWIDGYNVLTTMEAAYGGAVLLLGRDGALRDMCSLHGTWRRVEETEAAIRRIGNFCASAKVARCVWLLDSPVSNSGRLKALLRQFALEAGWEWDVDVLHDVDRRLTESGEIVCSADSAVLDRCSQWFPLVRSALGADLERAWVVDLSQAFWRRASGT